jgi:putative transport protein
VLFAGLFAGQFGQQLDAGVLGFLKEFGLVLFVFTIGLQLGLVDWPRTGGTR